MGTESDDHELRRRPVGDIDDLDRAIISELQQDGRRPYREIARNLETAEATIRFRAARLQESGVMSITAFAHPQELGSGQLATVFLRTTAADRKALALELSSWPEVMYLSSLAGHFDLMLQVVVEDTVQLHDLVGARLAQLPGVLETETLVELEIHKAHYQFPVT
jgi:Lrp/AsnC family transcriptional regulator, regulator for asnA, asnC and gidA